MKFSILTIVIALVIFFQSPAYANAVKDSDIKKIGALFKKANTLASDISQTANAIAEASQHGVPMSAICLDHLEKIASHYENWLLGLSTDLGTARAMRDGLDEKTALEGVKFWSSLMQGMIPTDRSTVNELAGSCQDSQIFDVKAQKLLDLISETNTSVLAITDRLGIKIYH